MTKNRKQKEENLKVENSSFFLIFWNLYPFGRFRIHQKFRLLASVTQPEKIYRLMKRWNIIWWQMLFGSNYKMIA